MKDGSALAGTVYWGGHEQYSTRLASSAAELKLATANVHVLDEPRIYAVRPSGNVATATRSAQ